MVTKGAVDVLLDRSIIMPEERKNIEQVNERFSNEGLRVLAFACRRVDSTAVSLADENGLNFFGPDRHDGTAPRGIQGSSGGVYPRRYPSDYDHRRP